MNSVKGLSIKRTAHEGEGGFTDTVSIRRRALINKPGNTFGKYRLSKLYQC